MSHLRRPEHDPSHPLHVVLRVRRELASLRTKGKLRALRDALREGHEAFHFRLIHFGIKRDRIDLICEAADGRALARGMQGLSIRLAKALNRQVGGAGKVFADRFHARALGSPSEVRWALAYVLGDPRRPGCADPFSSAYEFGGWRRKLRPNEAWHSPDRVGVEPHVWLLRAGWMRAGGLLEPGAPGAPAAATQPASSARR